MAGMKHALWTIVVGLAGILAAAGVAAAQNGAIEFVARATPTDGLQEPVRGFPIFLLRKSYEEIAKEAEATQPLPDKNAFIDKLDVSSKLKAWMKKNHTLSLSGEDFIHKLHPADILDIPEFRKAYMDRNAGDESVDFPKPKFKPSDQLKDPEKYKKLSAQYDLAIRHYIEQNPQSMDGIDLNLTDINPEPKWNLLLGKRVPAVRRLTLDLAQSKYLVGRTETDLQGQGFLRGISPGSYWISSLNVSADVGDARLRWDVPITVQPGQTEYVELSNVNALPPKHAAP